MVRGYIQRAKGEAREIAVERKPDPKRSERLLKPKTPIKPTETAKAKAAPPPETKYSRLLRDEVAKLKKASSFNSGADQNLPRLVKSTRNAENRLLIGAREDQRASPSPMRRDKRPSRSRSPLPTSANHLSATLGPSQMTVSTLEVPKTSMNRSRRDTSLIRAAPLFANESRSLSKSLKPRLSSTKLHLPDLAELSKLQKGLTIVKRFKNSETLESIRTILEGSHLEDFEVIQTLGQGAYATTSLAIHKHHQVAVALKSYTFGNTHKLKSAVDSECRVLAALDHSNIIKLFSRFERPSQTILVLE